MSVEPPVPSYVPVVNPPVSLRPDLYSSVLTNKQSREALAYTPTAILGTLFVVSLVDKLRGKDVKNLALVLDGASSFLTGVCGASNISFAEKKEKGEARPTELALVVFTNVITDVVLLANIVYNPQGFYRQAIRITPFVWNIVSASLLLNEDKIG